MSTTVINEKSIVQPEILKSEIVLTHRELEQEKQKYLKQIQKNIALPGFRPGKVPASIIHKKYADVAFYEGFENLLKEKTNETLSNQTGKVLYYVYNFENTGTIQDDSTDKKVEIEYLLEPKINIDIKNREIELIKYAFTDNQRKIFLDILILSNFLKDNPVEKLDDFKQMFFIISRLESNGVLNSEGENQNENTQMWLDIHPYEFEAYGLNELLPTPLERGKSYSIDLKRWMDILKSNFPSKRLSLMRFLERTSQSNDTSVSLHIHDIHSYPNFNDFIDEDIVREVFELDEDVEISLDLLYAKLNEIIDTIAEYLSGTENLTIGNDFIKNLIEIEVPENFVRKLYEYIKKEYKEYFSFDMFRREIIKELEYEVLKSILPNTFNGSINYEEFVDNVAKTYYVETLLFQSYYGHSIVKMYLSNLNAIKKRILQELKINNNEHRKKMMQRYQTRDIIFSFPRKLSQDVKTTFKIVNINQSILHESLANMEENLFSFHEFLGVKRELFV